jgi:hypothetical protein
MLNYLKVNFEPIKNENLLSFWCCIFADEKKHEPSTKKAFKNGDLVKKESLVPTLSKMRFFMVYLL